MQLHTCVKAIVSGQTAARRIAGSNGALIPIPAGCGSGNCQRRRFFCNLLLCFPNESLEMLIRGRAGRGLGSGQNTYET
jgi:hypothetical protein